MSAPAVSCAGLDLADASLVWLADAIGITDIVTIDRSGFDAYRTGAGKRFRNRLFP